MFDRGAIVFKLKSDIGNLQNGLKKAASDIGNFVNTNSKSFQKFEEQQNRLNNQLRDLAVRKDILNKRIQESTQKYGENSRQVQALTNNLANLNARQSQVQGRLAELGKGPSPFTKLSESIGSLGGVLGPVGGALMGIGGILGNLAGMALNAAKALGVGLVGAFAAVSGYGLKMGNSIQQTAIAFDTMLGDAGARRKLMADITEFAKTTPFERFDLIDSSKTLLAMGVSADKIIPTMQTLGDVSAGVSANVKDVAFVFGQVKAQGQAYTQDLNQFASRGIPIYEELGKVLGVSVAELREGMGDGTIKVNFDNLNTAFQNLTKEGAKFNNLMALQSRSLGGIVSNLKDGFDNLVLSFMGITSEGDVKTGSFFDLATQKAQQFQAWLSGNEAQIGQWGSRVFTAIGQGMSVAWDQTIVPVLFEFQNWFNNGGKESIKTFLREGWSSLQSGFAYFKDQIWPSVKDSLKQLMDYMASPQFRTDLQTVAGIIRDIASAIGAVGKAIQTTAPALTDLIKKDGAGAVFNPINQLKIGAAGLGKILGRATGGPVKAGQIYETGEFNRPEILESNGKQYMIPGNNGRVLNQNQITNDNKVTKVVNINNYGQSTPSVFTSPTLLFS